MNDEEQALENLAMLIETFGRGYKPYNVYVVREGVRWFWCPTCDCVSAHLDCCGNSLCNCGGCEQCKDRSRYESILDRLEPSIRQALFEAGVNVCG